MGLDYILHHLDLPGTHAKNSVCGLQPGVQPHQSRNPLLQTLLAHCIPSSCQRITSILTGRKQQVSLGEDTSSIPTVNTSDPKGCVLSQLLFSLYTNNCISKDTAVNLSKFADDTTVIWSIQDGDESAHFPRPEVGDKHQLHPQKGSAEDASSAATEEVWSALAAAEPVPH